MLHLPNPDDGLPSLFDGAPTELPAGTADQNSITVRPPVAPPNYQRCGDWLESPRLMRTIDAA